jgi:dynein light intermediate chain 1
VYRKPIAKDAELTADDDQNFLMKMQAQLNQNTPSSGHGQASPLTSASVRASPASGQKGPNLNSRGSIGSANSPLPGVQLDGKTGSPGQAGEGVLQNFFNSLLNRKSGAGMGSPGSNGTSTPKTSNRSDVAAELDRLQTPSNTPTQSSPLKKPKELGELTPSLPVTEPTTE